MQNLIMNKTINKANVLNYERIESIQGLRALGILLIFYSHLPIFGWGGTSVSGLGSVGVSLFIKISGFMIAYNSVCSNNKLQKTHLFRESILYCKKQIKKFYLLHIVTFLFALILDIYSFSLTGWNMRALTKECIRAVLNIFLLQSYIPSVSPIYYFSFNMVSWYLSMSLLFYLTVPVLKYCIQKIEKNSLLLKSVIFSIFVLQCLVSYCVIGNPYEKWIIYINPFFRLLEFMLAFIIGWICKNSNKYKFAYKNYIYIVEIVVILSFVYMSMLYEKIPPSFARGVFYEPITLMMVYCTICDNHAGIFSILFSNKVMVLIGNISFEIMMFHQIIIRYFKLFNISDYLTIVFVFLISFIWHYGRKRLIGKNKS